MRRGTPIIISESCSTRTEFSAFAACLSDRLLRGSYEARSPDSGAFSGTFRQFAAGPFRLNEVSCTGLAGRLYAADPRLQSCLAIVVQSEGALRLRRACGKPIILDARNILICQSLEDLEFEALGSSYRQQSLLVEPTYVAAVAPHLLDRLRRLDTHAGAGRLVASLLGALLETMDNLSAPEIQQALESCLTIIGAAFDPARVDGGRHNAQLLRSIQAYMQERLSEPRLDPDGIAAAFGISRRYLDRLFQEADASVASWLRLRRLEAAKRSLSQRAQRHRTIADIAYEAGFLHAAHFTRAFATQFRMTPSEYRRRRLQALSGGLGAIGQ